MLSALLRYRPWLFAASLLTWTVGACMPILTGLVNRTIFDDLQGRTQLAAPLWVLFAALVAIAIIRPLLLTLWFWVHITFESTIEALVRTNLVEWIVEKAGRSEPPPSPVTLVGHVRDDVPGHTDVINEWYRLSGEALFVTLALVIMVRIDPVVTALTFVPLATVVLVTHWMRARLPQLWAEAREATTTVTNVMGDAFGGVQAIKAAGAERVVVHRLRRYNDTRRDAEVRAQVASVRIDSLTDAVVVVAEGLVLLIAAKSMLDGRFSVGDFMLFTLYLDWMMLLPRRVGRLLSQRKESQRALQRLADTMTGTPLRTLVQHRPVHLSADPPEPPAPDRDGHEELVELRVSGLSYRYPDSTHGITDINLVLRRGTITVITGEIGSGKSTLLEVLLGLRRAHAGEIRWNGAVVVDPEAFMTPPRIAYKPQIPRLFSESLRDNILLGLPDDHAAIEAALHRAAFEDDVAAFPDRLGTEVGSRGVRLSGGQVQRASAARMFVRAPDLYVVDDLSSALDDETEQAVWDRLDAAREAGEGATYLMVSHRAAALRRADQIVVLHQGRVSAVGTLAQLRESSPVVRRILATSAAPTTGDDQR